MIGLLVAEIRGWLRVLAYWMADRASSRVHSKGRERLLTEWTTELDALRGRDLTQVLTAGRMFRRAAEVNRAWRHDGGGAPRRASHSEQPKVDKDNAKLLAVQALNRWIAQLDDDHRLAGELRRARSHLEGSYWARRAGHDHNAERLSLEALERWSVEVAVENPKLRDQLRSARSQLEVQQHERPREPQHASHWDLGPSVGEDRREVQSIDALERWIVGLGDDDSELREQLHRARRKLGTEP